MNILKRAVLIGLILVLVAAYFYFDLNELLTLDYLKSRLETFRSYTDANPVLVLGSFFVLYVLVTAVSLPGAAVMTIAAGALFGLLTGTILVSFASSIGATLAFLVARYILRASVQNRFGQRLKKINEGIKKDGAFYLFTLRLVPIFPFFLINLLMALTPFRTWTFYWVSQVGMLPGTIVYVNAGTQVAQIERAGDLLSPALIGAFALLGLFPWLARFFINRLNAIRLYKGWQKPKKFDRNLIVIGAGSAGLVTAYIAAAVKAKVTLIEKHKMGGECLNTGCVPSKTLIRSAKVAHLCNHLSHYGINIAGDPTIDFPAVMKRIHGVIGAIAPHDSVERYTKLGVDCRQGEARLLSPWEVEITHDGGKERLTARHIVIASGGRPAVPSIDGLNDIGYLTSETLWQIEAQPEHLLILGGGPIGCELAQSFARLGSEVTVIEMLPRLLPREDPEASDLIQESLGKDGVKFLFEHKATRFRLEDNSRVVYTQHKNGEHRLEFDQLIVAVGRKGNTEGLNLDTLGIETQNNGTLVLNEFLQTRYPNILACGDVAGPYQFTHVAAHQAWFAAVNALFGSLKRFKADYRVIPAATFTEPEVARVGLNEIEAVEQGIEYEKSIYDLAELDRAITDSTDTGFVKVLTAPGTDRILGVTIVGSHAGDLIAEFILAMRQHIGLNKILGTIHIYPTLVEANKYAAGQWKQQHKPDRLLKVVERFHRWRLST